MLKRIMEMFSADPAKATEEAVDPEERVRLATCVVLLEVANADEEFAPEERDGIVKTFTGRFGLSEEEAHELMEAAAEERDKSHDLWSFTNQINQVCSREEKIHIIEEVWRVIYADGTLDKHEDFLVHKLARLLNLKHSRLIDAKLAILKEVREQGAG